MFTQIDHVTICVPDLERGIEQYRKLGFEIHPGGAHPGKGTANAIAFNESDYVEVLAIADRSKASAALSEFIAAGGGIRYIVLQTDDLDREIAAMRARGVDVSDAVAGGRTSPTGQALKWKTATPGPRNPLPLVFIEQETPPEERRRQVPGAASHPNGVFTLERAYIVVKDAETAAATYAKVLGVPQPPLQRGTVIMSDMAVFQLGPTGLGIAQPYAPGPGADALAKRGPGPFQALYRTKSMGAAAQWMESHGLPRLPRGVRNTGEQAMLATPDLACGAYIGFVGPE